MPATLRYQAAAACPACAAVPLTYDVPQSALASDTKGQGRGQRQIALSLPTIHCAACISKIEKALMAHPDVAGARVNLTLKRAMVEVAPSVRAQDLAALVAAQGYEAHELDAAVLDQSVQNRAGRDLLMRLAVAGFAAMNVMLLSVAVWSGAEAVTRDMFHWISAVITLPAIAFSGQPFFRNARGALRMGRLNMDVPITLAIVLAVITSLWETALSGEHAYFDASLALTFFLLAGRYLDHRTRAIARSAAQELTALEVPRATRLTSNDEAQEVRVSELSAGDMILVRPGARVPVDGVVTQGCSEMNRSLLTGETIPVFAGPGQAVSAGEINLTGPLHVRADAVGADTSLHRLANLVAIAESGRSHYTSLADRAAKLYAPGVHILSALSFVGWYLFTLDMRTALNIAAAVLIITCPCALGLAVPTVSTAASGRLFRKGMLIKSGTALERLAQVDRVVFDKTGTLTKGIPTLTNLSAIRREDAELALALARASSHPLSRAMTRAMEGAGVSPACIQDMAELPGYGSRAFWNGQEIRLGRASWTGAAGGSETATYLKVGQRAPVAFTFADTLRPGAQDTVKAFRAAGIEVHLVSGDTPGPVQALAMRLGIRHWQAETLPEDKAAFVQTLERKGHRVLMVGDGLNDTAALAVAHVSASPASALDAARVASDIVLLGETLLPIAGARETAITATRRIRENFRIATLYNIIAVPLAVAGLATPLIAALAMSASSLTVSLNALRLR